MREIILEKLREIEETEKVKIIMAVESGSRAWGFESPDSDYDVRFIYVRDMDSYLKLEGMRDVIEWQLDDTLDINGWDLKKVLQQLQKSNSVIFEWCASPIVYVEREEAAELKKILPQYFSVKKGLYHYGHMAESTYTTYLKEPEVKVKKYFYALRPLLAAKWIIDKKTAPPVLFENLVKAELEEGLRPELDKLLEIKKVTPEMGTAPQIPVFNEYIEKGLAQIKDMAADAKDNRREWDGINELFLRLVRGEI